MFRFDLAERLGRTLAELDATIGAWELQLWAAKDEVISLTQARMDRHKGLKPDQALEQVRSDFRSHMRRKGQSWP